MTAYDYGAPPPPPPGRGGRPRRPMKHPRAFTAVYLGVLLVGVGVGLVFLCVASVRQFQAGHRDAELQGGVRATSVVTSIATRDDRKRNDDEAYTTTIVGVLDEPGNPVTTTVVGDRVAGVRAGDAITVVHRAGAPAVSALPGHPLRTETPAYGYAAIAVGVVLLVLGVAYSALTGRRAGGIGLAALSLLLIFGGLIFATANGDGATDHTLVVATLSGSPR